MPGESLSDDSSSSSSDSPGSDVEYSCTIRLSGSGHDDIRACRTKRSASPLLSQPPSKRRKLVETDLTVVVGEGAEKKIFPCHKLVLRLASEVFDSMFSHDMKEKQESVLELRDKAPAEWELFYSFIDPETAGLAQINRTNVLTLLPWFHEYGMTSLVCQCDRIIAKLANTGAQSDDLIHYALLSYHYELRYTKSSVLPIIASRIEKGDLVLDPELISKLEPLLLRAEYRILWVPIHDLLPLALGIADPNDFFEKKTELSFLVMKEQRLRVMEEVMTKMPKFISQLPFFSYEGRDRVKKAVAKKLSKELKGIITRMP